VQPTMHCPVPDRHAGAQIVNVSSNWPPENVTWPGGVVRKLARLQELGEPAAIESPNGMPPNSIGAPSRSRTWYLEVLVTPHPGKPWLVVQAPSEVLEEVPATIERLVGFCTVMFLVAVGFCPFFVYVTLTGTSPSAPLSACEVTVILAELVLASVTFPLVVLQLKLPPEGLPVAVRVLELGPVEPSPRK